MRHPDLSDVQVKALWKFAGTSTAELIGLIELFPPTEPDDQRSIELSRRLSEQGRAWRWADGRVEVYAL